MILIITGIIGLYFINTLQGDNIFWGKKNRIEKSEILKEMEKDIRKKISVKITSPIVNEEVGNEITVKGTAGKEVTGIMVCIGTGEWQKATGVANWQVSLINDKNGEITIYAKGESKYNIEEITSVNVVGVIGPVNLAPIVTITSGSIGSIITNQAFSITLNVNENYGFWSTNGSIFYQFSAGTTNIQITTTSTLRYYGSDGLNTSSTQQVIYTFDVTAPTVTITSGPNGSITTNQLFTITLNADENNGYYSINSGAFNQFAAGNTNVKITTTSTLRYYGFDGLNTSSTQQVIYTIDANAPLVTIISGPTTSRTTNQAFNVTLSVDEDFGYWSTNGSAYVSFGTETDTIFIDKTTTILKFYGRDNLGNTSSTQTLIYSFGSQGLFYTLIGGTEYSVSLGNANTSETIIIPEYYQGLPVRSLANYGFTNNAITNILIPNGVTTINASAFKSCDGLTSIIIPGSVNIIGNSAFQNCTGLNSVTISNGVDIIMDHAFAGCTGLTNIILPNTMDAIGHWVFDGCTNLPNITLPDLISYIGLATFRNCRSLTNIIIPNSITFIHISAFSGCKGLTSITIPGNVNTISNSAFQGCNGLTNIMISTGVVTIGNDAFRECSSLTSISIPNSVTSIGEQAFKWCYELTSLVIPNNVTSIRDSTFYECYGLTNIVIPNSVTSIGEYAFLKCGELTGITIPNSLTSIGNSAFSSCSNITNLSLPNSVSSIGSGAFTWCKGLTSISIPTNVTSINNNTFQDCSGLTNIILPNKLNTIEFYAFSDCSGLTSITIPTNVILIQDLAFTDCIGLTNIIIPKSVTLMGDWVFSGCAGLADVTMESESPPAIGSSIFLSTHPSLQIHVPSAGAVSVYQGAANWSDYSSKIVFP